MAIIAQEEEEEEEEEEEKEEEEEEEEEVNLIFKLSQIQLVGEQQKKLSHIFFLTSAAVHIYFFIMMTILVFT